MINACLIGCGRMGLSHAEHIHHSPHARLYGVVDPIKENAERVAKRYGAKIYENTEEALSDTNVNAVVIVSNTATHADLIIASAKAGKPIFCEKPIDLDLKRIDQCLKVVEECGVPLFVAFNRRFDPSFRSLKNKISEGTIGPMEILSISSRDAPFPDIAYLKTSGGMFRDMTIHDFDIARWLLQEEPTEVYATGSCLVDPRLKEFGDVDTAMITLKTKSGAICHINNSRRSVYGYDQRIEAFGAKGMLRVNNVTPTSVEFSFGEGVRTDNPHPSFPERYNDAYRHEINHFFEEVVLKGKEPEVSGKDGRQALVIAEAANSSLEKGQPVTIPVP
ncbi:MAG: Inositol 2-dehydrogenase [Chlamydiae bacterium]|nr:Inositol 2-dehydrogenase [Chlamydiota bacterium]